MFVYSNGTWAGSGDLNDPSEWLIANSKGQLVQATYPSAGAELIGGGALSANGDFAEVLLSGGSYTITGDLTTEGVTVGYHNPATLDIPGGTFVDASQFLYVGYVGSNTLSIESDAAIEAGFLTIGYLTGSTGNVTTTGTTSALNIHNAMYVGYAGNGSISIEGGANIEAGFVEIAYQGDSTGAVTVKGGSSLTTQKWNLRRLRRDWNTFHPRWRYDQCKFYRNRQWRDYDGPE
jgi:T5SS/PEP-CTERM-associated repeat protein